MKIYIILLLIFPFGSWASANQDLPKPPIGFNWVSILDNKSALLKPEGWHFRKDHSQGVDAYFISKEKVEGGSEFNTGLSLNVIYNVKKTTNVSPTQYAAAMVLGLEKKYGVNIIDSGVKKSEPFMTLFCRFKDHQPGLEDVIIHYFFIANDETETLWMFFYEAPEREWDAAWKTGTVLLKHLLIESEI
jgi:hypothetical protein